MATWRTDNSILTSRGIEILNKVKAGIGGITVTRVVAGSGRVPESHLYSQTRISGTTYDMRISARNIDSTGAEIVCDLTNDTITEDFELNVIGIYVSHPDYPGEQLYHISQCDEEDIDVIPPGSITPVTQGYSIYMEHGNSASFSIVVNQQGFVTRQEFEEYTKRYTLGRVYTKSNSLTALSSPGWYRIATTDYSNSGNLSALLFMGHNFSNGGSSGLTVSINLQIYAPSIVVLNHKVSNQQFFDRIRLAYNEKDGKCYIDVHYNSSLANAIVAGLIYFDYNTPIGVLELTMNDFVAVTDGNTSAWSVILDQPLATTKDGTVITSGGGTLNGDLNLKGDYTRLSFSDNTVRTAFLEKSPTTSNEFRMYNAKDIDNRSILVLNPETSSEDELLRLLTLIKGTTVQRNVIHTGNMLNYVAPAGLVHSVTSVNSNELITSTILGWISSMPENQIRNYVLNIPIEGLVLTGGKWFLAINKASSTHASIVATRYDSAGAIVRVCSLINGTLTGWTSFTSSPIVPATVEE